MCGCQREAGVEQGSSARAAPSRRAQPESAPRTEGGDAALEAVAPSERAHGDLLGGAGGARSSCSCGSVRALQRRYGNRYVNQVLSAAREGGEDQEALAAVGAAVARGGGRSLDRGVRERMEVAFGVDFEGVQVHADEEAHELNGALGARAFTTGDHVFFRRGEYDPGSERGRRLIAHELTHVVQQTGPAVRTQTLVGESLGPFDEEAEAVAGAVVEWERQGAPLRLFAPRPERLPHTVAGVVQRQPLTPGQRGAVGAVTGALVGAAVGFAVGSIPGAIVGALVGAAAGGAIGALTASPLTYTTITAARNDGCGGYTWAVRWGLQGSGAATANGFVVQKVDFDQRRQTCGGAAQNFAKTYWEAWEVRNGAIFVGTSTTPHNADTFSSPSRPNQKGVNRCRGWARFIPGYTAPTTWGNVTEAGSLPATTAQPAGWSDSGTLARDIRVDFDCCTVPNTSTMTKSG